MIDALDTPDRAAGQGAARLRAPPAGMQGAARALRDRAADVGHDPRRARRPQPLLLLHAKPSATPAWTSPSTNPTSAARPATSPARDRQRCAGRCSKPRSAPAGAAHPTTPTTSRPRSGSAATAPACRSRANSQAQLPHAARTRRGGAAARMTTSWCAPSPHSHRCAAAGSRHAPAATTTWTAFIDRAAATLPPAGSPHQPSCRRPGTTPDRGPR